MRGPRPAPEAAARRALIHGVIVASSISKSGDTITGDTVHLVIVQTDPGYAPNPGHAGTGIIVGSIC